MRHVSSADNAQLKRVRALVRDARLRLETGRSVIEGEHLCRAWLDQARMPELALISDDALAREDIRGCLDRLGAEGAELISVPARLLRAVVSTDSAVPIACVIRIEPGRLDRCTGTDCVVLDGIQDPGNAGTILRTAAAAGVPNVIAGPGTASLWSTKVLRAGMGAHPVLNLVEVDDLADAFRQLPTPAVGTAADAERTIYQRDLRAPTAWVFGSEGGGLSVTARAALAETLAIPQAASVESINVASAAAICLFEMRRQRMR